METKYETLTFYKTDNSLKVRGIKTDTKFYHINLLVSSVTHFIKTLKNTFSPYNLYATDTT